MRRMRRRRRRLLLTLPVVAVALAVATAQPIDIRSCVKRNIADLPAADYAACGLDDTYLWGFSYALYMDKKCATPACMRLYGFVDAANPTECYMVVAANLLLRSRILTYVYAACAARTATPAPSTPPLATPTPALPLTRTPTLTPTLTSTQAPPSTPPTTVPLSTSVPNSNTPTASESSSSGEARPSAPASSDSSATPAPTSPPSNADSFVQSPDANSSSAADQLVSGLTSVPVRDVPPTDAQARVAVTSTPSSSRLFLWIGIALAAVAVIGSVLFVWRRRSRAQDQETKIFHTNASSNGAATVDDSATYALHHASDESQLISTRDRELIEAMLRDDDMLESWRIHTNGIVEKRFLGKGGYAYIHLVALPNARLLASKRLATNQLTTKQFTQLVGEVHIAATLKHDSVVRFAGVAWTSPFDFQVLFEFMEGGDLRTYLDKNKPLRVVPPTSSSSWSPLKLQMTLAIAEGLAYAHSFNPPLVHRDLKSRNILLTRDLQAKISDFGVSRFLSDNDTMTTGMGTTRWLAPEVISGGGTYNELCDIYSFGVVLTELDTHDVPFAEEMMDESGHKTRSELWLLQQVARGHLRPSLSTSCPEGIRALATRCLSFDAGERPNALEIAYALRKMHR